MSPLDDVPESYMSEVTTRLQFAFENISFGGPASAPVLSGTFKTLPFLTCLCRIRPPPFYPNLLIEKEKKNVF